MRILLDTNILVRAAANEQGLAGRLVREIASGPHVLVSSPYVLNEVVRVLAYARLQARWRLGEKTIGEFVSRVGNIAEIVLTTTPPRIVTADPDDRANGSPGWSRCLVHSRRSLAGQGCCRVLRRPKGR